MKTKLDFDDVPNGWALCFMHECARCDECLRFQAGKMVPSDCLTAVTVLPQALTAEGCRAFRAVREEQVAWGFTHLFDVVTHQDYALLRKEVEQLLGSRYEFHRFHTGARRLRSAQQMQLRLLFERYGYTESPVFDHQETELIFE